MALIDIILAAVIAAVFIFAVIRMIKNLKKGCSCGCSSCENKALCGKDKEPKDF